MSYSALYEVFKTTSNQINEYSNGHGSAPPIWEYLSKQYLGWDNYHFKNNSELKPLWNLLYDKRVPMHLRFALGFCCDGALIEKDRLQEAADYSDLVYIELKESPIWGEDKVNHWKSLANDLRSIKPKKRALGYGLCCTSVCDIWQNFPNGEIEEKQTFYVFNEIETPNLLEETE